MSSSSSSATPNIQQIQKSQLEDIIEQIRTNGREESGYVVIDVRNVDEIRETGKLDECVETLPLPFIAAEGGAFSLEPEEFEEKFGFVKPSPDETLVLSCKAGIRSMHAAYFASLNGHTQLVNYSGGADDWFGGMQGWWKEVSCEKKKEKGLGNEGFFCTHIEVTFFKKEMIKGKNFG